MTDDINNKQYDDEREKIGTLKANIQLIVVLGLIIIGIIFSQLMSGVEGRKIEGQKKQDLLVEAVTITPQTKAITFKRTGNVEVNGQINIVPQVSGRVVKISDNLNDGGVFEKDEVLFNIEKVDFINQINIAKAQVEQARTALSIQEAETQAATAEWKSLNPEKDTPELVARIPQLNQAKANLLAARAQLEDARLDYKRSKFSYNFGGRIVDTTIELGQFIQAGQNYGTAYPVKALEVSVPLTDRLLPYIQDKDDSEIILSTEYAGKPVTMKGKIDRIGSTLDRTTRFINAIISSTEDNWDVLLPGVFVDVEFIGKKVENIWEIPTKSIQGQNKIWIIEDGNKLKSLKLDVININENFVTAIGDGKTIKIVSGLLKGGNEGMSVRVKKQTDNQSNSFPQIDAKKQPVLPDNQDTESTK